MLNMNCVEFCQQNCIENNHAKNHGNSQHFSAQSSVNICDATSLDDPLWGGGREESEPFDTFGRFY